MSSFAVAAPVAATDNAKWFVCKYVGTPGADDDARRTDGNPMFRQRERNQGAARDGGRVLVFAWMHRDRPIVLGEDTWSGRA